MNARKVVLAIVMAFMALLGTATADASCYVLGKVSQVWVYSSGAYAFVEPATAAVHDYTYYFWTTSDRLLSTLENAQHSGRLVMTGGDAAACATSGAYRWGGYVETVQLF